MDKKLSKVSGRLKIIVVHAYNIPNYIAHHVFGEDCTPVHRMKAKGIVMMVGVVIAHTPTMVPMGAFALVPDLIGYLVHGIGGYPFIEHFVSNVKRNDNKKKEDTTETD